jgi:hypothetical protein
LKLRYERSFKKDPNLLFPLLADDMEEFMLDCTMGGLLSPST